jgi:2-haloacid dehalogenase
MPNLPRMEVWQTRSMSDPPVVSIEAVVFDMGGVLLDWNPRHLYRQLFTDEDAMERFLTELDLIAWNVANHDSGARALTESTAELARRHPEYAAELAAWSDRYHEMVGGPIDGSLEVLAELRGRVPLYLLSNVPREPIERLRQEWEFFAWFDGQVVSAEEGLIKPDPRLYQVLLDRYGLAPEATVLIDDMAYNVDAAAALGIRAIQFESAPQLRQDLHRLGLL